MKIPPDEDFPAITALVSLRDNRMTNSLIINRGTENGITINRPVLAKKALIGRTYKLTKHCARIQPL